MKKTHKKENPWAVLDALHKKSKEPTEPGWFSTSEYAARYNLSSRNALMRLKHLVSLGKLKEWRGIGMASCGSNRMKNKYKPV